MPLKGDQRSFAFVLFDKSFFTTTSSGTDLIPKKEKDPHRPNMSMNLSALPQRGQRLVENTGVEPVTSCVQGRRSSQLS